MTNPVEPFYLRNLFAHPQGVNVPLTEFMNGEDFELAWESNGTAFTVYAANDAQPVWTGTATNCLISGGRTANTTFVVSASVTGGEHSGTPYPAYETIYLYDAITVTIENPTLTPLSVTTPTLDVTGTTTVTGPTTLGDTTVGGTLTVSGPAMLDGGALATGLTVTGTTSLKSGATLASAEITGTLNVTGPATMGAAIVDGLTVLSSTTMMASPQLISGNVMRTSNTDGLLVGLVSYPTSSSDKLCSAIMGGYSEAFGWVYATGGNTAVTTDRMWGVANTFTIPVRAGTRFMGNVQQVPDRELDAPAWLWWVPFGRNSTLTEYSAEEVAAMGIEIPVAPPPVIHRFDVSTPVAQLVATLVEMTGSDQPKVMTDELVSAITALATHQI